MARDLIRAATTTRSGVVSFQVVQEFFNISLRRFVPAMSLAEAEQYLATVFRPLLAVQSSVAIYGEALRIYGRYSLSWYDSLIVAAAVESQCTILYSEDMQHGFSVGPLEICNPFR
jgi:predicted nucleic acid-binding protein